MTLQASAIPSSLLELDQWLLWRVESVGGRPTKVPYSLDGRKASSVDARRWASFELVCARLQRYPKAYAGLGFVFVKGGGLVGIDLDDCLDDSGQVKSWGQGVVSRFFDTYMEISPSNKGLKIWLRGDLPANLPGVKVADGSIEIYDHARYFTVTGRAFRGAPLQIEDHAADVLLLYNHLTAATRKVWPLQPLGGGRIPYGQQHSTLVSIAGTLRARRVCDEAILACLLAVNAHQCEQPGTPEAISRIVRSTRTWGAR
jgi:primase-polymerase (primpol)-like protein